MTARDWAMCIFVLLGAAFCLLIAHDFSRKRLISPKNSRLCKGRITDLDDEAFTVEYTYQHQSYTYTTSRNDYYALFGYRTDIALTPEEKRQLAEEAKMLNRLIQEGYSHDYYFSPHTGMKMLVWIECDNPHYVLRIHNDNDSANRSVGRAFRAVGIFLLLAIVIIVCSEHNC